MTGNKPLYYWDTCIILAWLKNEARPPGEMDGLLESLARFKRRECSIATSVLTLTELTDAKMPAGTEALLEEVMQRPNFSRIAVDIRIANLARDLRNYYLAREVQYNGHTIMVPDAIHLATAILYRASEFHTFDRHNNGKHKSLGLIPLSGNVAGHNLTICSPVPTPQMGLLPE
jgi:predicted nucleic acid-binding protein